MSEQTDDGDRQRRLDALRRLTGQEPQLTADAPSELTTAPHASLMEEHDTVAARPRWQVAALIAAVVVVILAIAGAVHLRNAGDAGPQGATLSPTLSVRAFDLGGDGVIYCASQPVWSPDGKQIALFGQTNAPTDDCAPYNYQTAIAEDGGGVYQSVNVATGFALVILDSASGHVTQRSALNLPDRSALCAAVSACQIQNMHIQSLAWTPDGHSLAFYLTYDLMTGADASGMPLYRQEASALLITQPDASAAPRLLLAAAPPEPANATGDLPGLPLVTWNLKTGAATTSAIPSALTGATPPYNATYGWQPGQQFIQVSGDTIPFAPAYQWTASGRLASASTAPASAAISPWASGVVGERRGATDPVLYRTSQWLWSPDGQFVTPNLATTAFLNLPGVNTAPSAGAYMPPLVTAPNGSTSATIPLAVGSEAGISLAQSPDGKLLASFYCAPDGTGVLAIRAAKSSDPLAQTRYNFLSGLYSLACRGDIGPIVWSPDGKQIATTDEQDAQLVIWRVNVHV